MRKSKLTLADGTVVPVEITELPGGDRFRWVADEKYLSEIAWTLNSLGLRAMVDRDAGGKHVKVSY